MISPTDLDDDETAFARSRLAELDTKFAAAGIVRDPRLREVFTRTWRHPYVPSFYPHKDGPPILCIDPSRRREWLDAVYSDVTLLTKLDQVPLSRVLGPATATTFASSSTLPSLMLEMLELLDLDEHGGGAPQVLEIGTGTGYNTALLCGLAGDRRVTSVDIDDELVELARERLAATGYHPQLAAVDGHDGYPPGEPYDRIIATCGVTRIPPAWLDQAAPGAVLVADVHGPISGTLVTLTVGDERTATGRFVAHWADFMPMRGQSASWYPSATLDDDAVESWTTFNPGWLTQADPFAFVAQWHLPHTTYGRSVGDHGPAIMLKATDGSYAEIDLTPDDHGRYRAREQGPRRLAAELDQAARFWTDHDHPPRERFGLTVTPSEQYVCSTTRPDHAGISHSHRSAGRVTAEEQILPQSLRLPCSQQRLAHKTRLEALRPGPFPDDETHYACSTSSATPSRPLEVRPQSCPGDL